MHEGMGETDPLETAEENGSSPSRQTLESEKLSVAMRLRYYGLNGSYAA